MNSFFDMMDGVRQAMLDSLGDPPPGECAGLCLRIRKASDMEHLWHLRGDLMLALALIRGEAHAAQVLARITAMFEQGLPRGLAGTLKRTHPQPLESPPDAGALFGVKAE